jgi:predicted secreted hydrolase
VRVPSAALDVEIEPWVADQELALSFAYWEGACDVKSDGAAIGRAYVELVGYAPVASDSAFAAAR